MDDFLELQLPAVGHEGYLWLPRREASAAVEDFLSRWAENGYLFMGVTQDVAPHGDVQFLQGRPAPKPLPAAEQYWEQHAALHAQLCSIGLQQMPIGLGPGPDEPLALAWLLPAPARGVVRTLAGFEQTVVLTPEQRNSWLDWMARRLGAGNARPHQRILVQPPGPDQPACWHYGSYRGDAPITGPHTERLRTLLTALPRYACDITTAALAPTPAEAAAWPLLLNQRPGGSMEGMRRGQGHRELFLTSLPEGQA